MTDEYISKKVCKNEYEIYKYLKDTDIVPELQFTKSNTIKLKKYPHTLESYHEHIINTNTMGENIIQIMKNLEKQIEKLHSHDIFHGDLNLCNVLVDPESKDVRLIDFEYSVFISKINQNDIIFFNEFLDPLNNVGRKFENVSDLINYEKINWMNDFD